MNSPARPAVRLSVLAAASLAAFAPAGASAVETPAPGLFARAQEPAPPTAREKMEATLAKVSRILLSPELESRAKREGVKALIDANVDFETVSRLVLARNWSKFSEPQQEEFVDLFRRHLLHTYWTNADYSEFKGIEVTGDRKEQRRDWTVLSKVTSRRAEDVLIDYRLRQQGEEGTADVEWKIIDILVEGVSLVSNFRSQFQSIVSNAGPAGLIELLREKVAQAERAEAEAEKKGG